MMTPCFIVQVPIPDEVWVYFSGTESYANAVNNAFKSARRDVELRSTAVREEVGVFNTQREAQMAVDKMRDVILRCQRELNGSTREVA